MSFRLAREAGKYASATLRTFEFSAADGNPIGANVFWTQRSLLNESVDEGAIHVANDGEGLGGLDALVGVLVLDRAAEFGTLRLVGSGEDALGGDFASVSFDITGEVQPM